MPFLSRVRKMITLTNDCRAIRWKSVVTSTRKDSEWLLLSVHLWGFNLMSFYYCNWLTNGLNCREQLNLAVLSLKESDDLATLRNKWWFDRGECANADKQETTQNELSLSNVAGIFYILIGGLVLALAVAFFEFLYWSRVDAKKHKVYKHTFDYFRTTFLTEK